MLSKTFVKKRADAEKFFGYRISKQRGSKIRDGKYAREAGAQNTPPSQKKIKFETSVRGYQRF